MPQTSYVIYMPIGFEGQVPSGEQYNFTQGTYLEYTNGESLILPFGRFVEVDAEGLVTLVNASTTAATISGVTQKVDSFEKSLAQDTTNIEVGFPPGRETTVRTKGYILMIAEDAVTAGANVFVRIQNAGAEPEAIGRVGSDADGGDRIEVTTAKFARSAQPGGLVPVFLDLPFALN